MMQNAIAAMGRALLSQLRPRMLLLTILPFVISLLIWGVILYLGLQPALDGLQGWFLEHEGFGTAGSVLGMSGWSALKTVLVPLLAMWLLLPLMVFTALIFIGVLAMPAIVRHVSSRHYPQLAQRRGGSLLGGVWIALQSFAVFIFLWMITLPLSIIPPLGLAAHALLWGWLTFRVISYDALAEHADADELRAIRKKHRLPLLVIGMITAALGVAPTLLWLGGALAVFLIPFLAPFAIWLYVLVFVFSGLWFTHYCLKALTDLRLPDPMQPSIKNIN